MSVSVHVIDPDELTWTFDDKPPSWRTTPRLETWGHVEAVDPTPCYRHEVELVEREVAHVDAVFPIGVPVTFHISPWESLGRTNGWASQQWVHGSEPRTFEVAIGLGGKRIPLHPAMTRYLVSHEYGHAVDYWLCHIRGLEANGLDEEYRKIRDLPESSSRYGPGRWHANVGELIANDFRVLIAKRELDFWPHPGIARPEEIAGVRRFWKHAATDAAWETETVAA